MKWVNFFHIYQPPYQRRDIIKRVVHESYRPLVSFLQEHKEVKITLNISGILIEQLQTDDQRKLVQDIGSLAERHQVELVGTAYAHPILPLIPAPERERQIAKHQSVASEAFGSVYHPEGFFSPEMCYNAEVERTIRDAGFQWIILDEIAYTGRLKTVRFDKRYQTPSGMNVVFRNRHLSNYLSFAAPISSPKAFWEAVARDHGSSSYLITAMDGENLGHHRKELLALWEQLVTDQRVQTCTVSEYLTLPQDREVCTPAPSSWSSEEQEIAQGTPFGLWKHPDNNVHALQWQLVGAVMASLNDARKRSDAHLAEAETLFDRAIASDQFWWASAHPWWDADMIISRAELLKGSVKPLTLSSEQQHRIDALVEDIRTTAQTWHREGIAERMRTGFLQETSVTPWMANKHINS